MKKISIIMLMIAMTAGIAFSGTNVDVNQLRWKAITWETSTATVGTIDEIETIYSDWFYIGDGNLIPDLITFTTMLDVADSASCTIKLQVSNDKVNKVTALVTLETLSNVKADAVYEGALTTIPLYIYGRLVVASTVVGSYTIGAQRQVKY